MKFAMPGLIVGAVLSLFLFTPRGALQVYPLWHGEISAPESIEPMTEADHGASFFVRTGDGGFVLEAKGRLKGRAAIEDSLTAWTGNGMFYAQFQKVGDSVEYFGLSGDRFWKIKSMEYPYLSRSGKLILLLNGDQTMLRFVDNSGNEIGDRFVTGMTCTVISFSGKGDFAAVGFLDGSYHAISPAGKIIRSGKGPAGMIVKSIAVSDRGKYLAVHLGDTARDGVRIVDTASGDAGEAPLAKVHVTRTALHVTDEGRAVAHDNEVIRCFKKSGAKAFTVNVPHRRPGMSSIAHREGAYVAAYTRIAGGVQAVLFDEDGKVVLMKDFPAETYLEGAIERDFMLLRGSDNLYCYRLGLPDGK